MWHPCGKKVIFDLSAAYPNPLMFSTCPTHQRITCRFIFHPTSMNKFGRPQHRGWPSVSPTALPQRRFVRLPDFTNISPTPSQCVPVFLPTFANLLGDFLPTFCKPFTNFWLLIFSYNVPHIGYNFWCLKDVRKISYFKACSRTCFEA